MSDIGTGSGESVNLALYKNNSNKQDEIDQPGCAKMYAKVIVHGDNGDDIYKSIHLRCGKWSCPDCARKNAKVLRWKTKIGLSWAYDLISKENKGFRFDYYFKFLTLTVDGKKWRSENSIESAEEQIKANWNKLRSAIQKRYGKFEFVWVCERQRDGYPHLHVLMVGKAIADPGIKEFIYDLWISYGMGFSFIKKVYGGVSGVSAYLTKYMTKELESGRKGSRVYSMSKKLRSKCKIEKRHNVTVLEVGFLRWDYINDCIKYEPIKQTPGLSEFEVERALKDREKVLESLEEYFIEQGLAYSANFK